MNKIVFIGNFVNDVILIHEGLQLQRGQSFHDIDHTKINGVSGISGNSGSTNGSGNGKVEHKVTRTSALGGSVTYGSLAASVFGNTKSFIVSKVGEDINSQFVSMIEDCKSIDLGYLERGHGLTSSYHLNYYNNKKNRSLSLKEKGSLINLEQSLKCVETERPDAIFFVPVCGELDVDLVENVVDGIKRIEGYIPKIVACDVQGFLRTFKGERVTTRSMDEMVIILERLGKSFNQLKGTISLLKAEHGEAVAILNNNQIQDQIPEEGKQDGSNNTTGDQSDGGDGTQHEPLDPGTCAKQLIDLFGFTMSCVTMGGDGGFVSSGVTGQIYIPTFKPVKVADETGCGDTFLTCTSLELLETIKSKQPKEPIHDDQSVFNYYQLNGVDIIHCIQVGSASASFLVEEIGPNGFKCRDLVLDRVNNGTKQVKPLYLQWNRPLSPSLNNEPVNINTNPHHKPIKSTTHYQ